MSDPVRFGGKVVPGIDELLREAAAAYHQTAVAEGLLREAQSRAPECLPVYFALYKFYFYKQRLEEAEGAVLTGLETAARQGGFAVGYPELGYDSAPWADVASPAHFFLFSLKALAFIRLRMGRVASCTEILDKLAELDPHDQVGGSVIRALAQASH